MSTNSSWVPSEDALTLFSERCWLQGVLVSTFAYGVGVCLYFLSLHRLSSTHDRAALRARIPLIIFITIAILLGTIFMISLSAFTQMAFIDDRNYPGGPSAFENNMFSIPIDDAGNVAFVLSNWLCDAMLVWRYKVFYQNSRFPTWALMILPCLALVGSVALGIAFIMQLSTTNAYVTNGINFTLPYLGLSLALNIVLTIAIVLRLLSFKRHVTSALGSGYGREYTSTAAMVIESAAIYSVVSFTFLILFGKGNAVSQVFLQSLSQIQIIAMLLIVYRLAQGKGWTAETVTRVVTAQTGEETMLGKTSSPARNLATIENAGSHMDHGAEHETKEVV